MEAHSELYEEKLFGGIHMKRFIGILLSVTLLIGICFAFPVQGIQSESGGINATEFAESVGEMISQSTGVEKRLIVKSKNKIKALDAVSVVEGDGLYVLQFTDTEAAKTAYDYYSALSCVEYVEYDRAVSSSEVRAEETTPETNGHLSWGVASTGLDRLCGELAENNVELTQTVVAVVDSGVDYTHEFLKGRVVPTKINTSSGGTRNDCMDTTGHGTQVAGIIADSTPDSVIIKPYKVLDDYNNGTFISVAAGINCAVNDGVDVINLSLGFYEESNVLRDAITHALENDIVVVGAAGNDATDEPYYPASYPDVLKITAVNDQNFSANFTNFGDDVNFAAPGVRIYTTTVGGGYTTVSGTSFAAPFASAVASLIRATLPHAAFEDVFDIMKKYAVLDTYQSYNSDKYGWGVLNAPVFNPENIFEEKTQKPYFSHPNDVYNSAIDITIHCDTPDSVIYYTLDGSIPLKDGASTVLYDGNPIRLESSRRIYAVAYGKNSYRSSVATFASLIAPEPSESCFTINKDGFVTSYTGSITSLTVPDTINGITTVGIADGVFADTNLREIILPDSVTEIGVNAFKNCNSLIYFLSRNASVIGESAFQGCKSLSYIVLGELTKIGKYAFCETAADSYYLREASFSLSLSKLTDIPEGAFMNSGISSVNFGYVDIVSAKAFRGCNALVSVDFDGLNFMPAGTFKDCASLRDVKIGRLTYLANGSFSSCESLERVTLSGVEFVDSNAFENCSLLSDVELPKAKTVYSNAFNGCDSLRVLELPSMTSFETELYLSDTDFPKLPRNLTDFIAPMLTSTVRDMFRTAIRISNVVITGATSIAPYTFRGCYNMYLLEIHGVEQLEKDALSDCVIRFVDAPNLVSARNLPSHSGILLSNNFVEAYETAEDLIVYGTAGTFVERYARYKGYDFVPIPLIYNEIPKYITENSERINVSAVGFDLEYQWYWNTENSTENGTPIEGATESSYTFTSSDTAPYYYCKITQNDLGVVTTVTTDVIIKDTTPANYTHYNAAVDKTNKIDRSKYANIEILDEALAVDVSGKFSCEQQEVDAQTRAILDAIAALKLKSAKTVTLTVSKTDLGLLEKVKIVSVIRPVDAIYDKVVWSCDNKNVLTVTQSGTVMCVGDGEAVVTVTIYNSDGTITKNTITFNCDLTFLEKFLSIFVRGYIAITEMFEKM